MQSWIWQILSKITLTLYYIYIDSFTQAENYFIDPFPL